MAYKAGEGTPQRTPNSTDNPRNLLPLKIASMFTTLPWNPFLICEIEVSPNDGPSFCCGMTKKGAPCKNSIKLEDTKIGHQKLNNLTREPFQLSTLQSKLCAIAKEFLCARWHRQRQAAQGASDLSLQNLRLSEDVDEIHCVFCLAEDEEQATECVILRCDQCRAQAHLSCAEEWLEKRRTGFGTSCCVCRNEGSLDALIRPVRVPSASEPSTDREPVTVRHSAPNNLVRVSCLSDQWDPHGVSRAEWAASLSQSGRDSSTARPVYLCTASPVGTTNSTQRR
ncbi:unnamed protein product [Penicillium salamii]|nr:unnamed protein product [Penicillium salamii]